MWQFWLGDDHITSVPSFQLASVTTQHQPPLLTFECILTFIWQPNCLQMRGLTLIFIKQKVTGTLGLNSSGVAKKFRTRTWQVCSSCLKLEHDRHASGLTRHCTCFTMTSLWHWLAYQARPSAADLQFANGQPSNSEDKAWCVLVQGIAQYR